MVVLMLQCVCLTNTIQLIVNFTYTYIFIEKKNSFMKKSYLRNKM